ncbi:isochorismatase [Cupriavidus agavae]|uniref:isochorismatase n=1 Tax=Cupriavidus agavae TaxID=1001822 RepID=UPI001F353D05|nr:isochorismatase [Cupriavidus agavae]
MNTSITPFTVSVYPIQQTPGVWFANYMISEYSNGSERVVANVSMRHATHGSELRAKQAARRAGERVAVGMRVQQLVHADDRVTSSRSPLATARSNLG